MVKAIFQHCALFSHLTVAEDIGFALRILGRPKSESAPPRPAFGRQDEICEAPANRIVAGFIDADS